MPTDRKILIGLDEILKHLSVSKPTFKLLLEAGLPAAFFNRRWYAHVDHLDDFFKKLTHPHSQFVKHRATAQIDEDPE
jgi:hypothetical protein